MTEENNTVRGNLGKAGSSLGNLAGQVAKKVRSDLTEGDPDSLGKSKADASEAVGSFRQADSRDDYLAAGKDFANNTGTFLKGVADSVKSVVGEARESEDASSTRSAFASVVESSRDKLDDTVDKVRARKAAREAAESTNGPETDIIEGEVLPNPEDPQEPRV